jgi:hypothetical protein
LFIGIAKHHDGKGSVTKSIKFAASGRKTA